MGIAKGIDPSNTSTTLEGSGTSGDPLKFPVKNIVDGALQHDDASTNAAGSVEVLICMLSKLGSGLSKFVSSLNMTFKFALVLGGS